MGAILGPSRTLVGIALLTTVLLATSAHADPIDCARNKTSLTLVNTAIAAIEKDRAPERARADMLEILDLLIEGLKNTQKGIGDVTGPADKARDKLDSTAKYFKDNGMPVPAALAPLRASMDKLSKTIGKATDKYDKTAVGQVHSGLNRGAKLAGEAVKKLEQAREVLRLEQAQDDAAHGTGAEQIRALKTGFDALKGRLAVDEVPGLGDLFNAYSDAMGSIADNVGRWETQVKAKIKQADDALRGTELMDGVDDIYTGFQSDREKEEKRLAALKDRRVKLAKMIEDDGCNVPPPPPDPCAVANGPNNANNAIASATKRQRDAYNAALTAQDSALSYLARHALEEPQFTPSAEETALGQDGGLIYRMREFARTGAKSDYIGQRDPGAMLEPVLRKLGLKIARVGGQSHARSDVQAQLAAIDATLPQKLAAAHKESLAQLATAQKTWAAEQSKLLQTAKNAGAKVGPARQALDEAVAKAVPMEVASRQWDEKQTKQFDECFPQYAKLHGVKKNCPNTGGLVGGLNKVNCEIGGK